MLVKPQTRRQFGTLLGATLFAFPTLRASRAHDASLIHSVDIKAFRFEPEMIEIATGDTVEWTNHDLAPHTATGTTFDWDTGTLEKGASQLVSFEAPGTYEYFCAFHPHMKARVIVTASS
ncbi:MAG: cupredoxin domain-containing protein [Pelagimonas sp.]|jgi:plastocyanin|uniref:cupredoxin domain-containing protein n=1 Tax=Pelagimonas sp. TaxID=2073170 RepID=UPI003D6C6F82